MKTALILSGPTHEYIDPVRFIGNASSGRMGKALAEEARSRGFCVEFITGPVAEANLPKGTHLHRVTGASEMLAEAEKLFPAADVIIFAAAVADYTPAERLNDKMPKSEDELVLRLSPTPDIARTLGAHKRPNQTAIGFALQTSDGEAHARRKLEAKNLDGILLNTPATLGAENGTFSLLLKQADHFLNWGCISKATCAIQLFDQIQPMAAHES